MFFKVGGLMWLKAHTLSHVKLNVFTEIFLQGIFLFERMDYF